MAIHTGVLPPTINLDHPGEGCDLDYIPNVAREARVNHVMSNSFGFGGHNASLLIGRYTPVLIEQQSFHRFQPDFVEIPRALLVIAATIKTSVLEATLESGVRSVARRSG